MFKLKKTFVLFGIIFLAALFLFSGLIDRIYVAPILMYHSVHPGALPKNRLEVSDFAFQRQMAFLKRNHYNVVSLEKLADLVREKKRIPPRTVALTFDDGIKDIYNYAFPVLKKYNFPATMFIILDEVDRPQNDRFSWEEIKVMQDSGVITFGSHALGPEPLINIKSEEEIRRQIFESKRILEEKLGKRVNTFSYPEGRFNDAIRRMVVDAGYQAAVTTSVGKKFPNDDVFALKRLRISSTSDSLFVFCVESSGLYTFMKEHRDSD